MGSLSESMESFTGKMKLESERDAVGEWVRLSQEEGVVSPKELMRISAIIAVAKTAERNDLLGDLTHLEAVALVAFWTGCACGSMFEARL